MDIASNSSVTIDLAAFRALCCSMNDREARELLHGAISLVGGLVLDLIVRAREADNEAERNEALVTAEGHLRSFISSTRSLGQTSGRDTRSLAA